MLIEKQGERNSQRMIHSQRQHEPNHDKGQYKGRIMESLDLEHCVNHQRRGLRGLFMVWNKEKSGMHSTEENSLLCIP